MSISDWFTTLTTLEHNPWGQVILIPILGITIGYFIARHLNRPTKGETR